MRENMGLFRGKQLNNGEWVVGYYVRLYDSKGNVSHRIYHGDAETDCGDFYPDWYEVDPKTVGECTGLKEKDKNGKLIFEGDIVKATVSYNNMLRDKVDHSTEIYEVKYHMPHCYFYLARERNNLLFDGNWNYFLKDIEVIGNIHDNKELFES